MGYFTREKLLGYRTLNGD